MRREIVGDDVNVSPARLMGHQLFQESDKVGTGVTRRRFACDFSRADLQRGKE
jgi:hypothetical protein